MDYDLNPANDHHTRQGIVWDMEDEGYTDHLDHIERSIN